MRSSNRKHDCVAILNALNAKAMPVAGGWWGGELVGMGRSGQTETYVGIIYVIRESKTHCPCIYLISLHFAFRCPSSAE